jgi:hypothetical protein
MIQKLLCLLGIHHFKMVHVDLTFSYIEKIETFECVSCKTQKIIRKKIKD